MCQKQTGKRSGEVVENTYLWKKRTENEPKTKLLMLLKIKQGEKRTKNEPKKYPRINVARQKTDGQDGRATSHDCN